MGEGIRRDAPDRSAAERHGPAAADGRDAAVGQQAFASSAGSVVQAGRDASITVEQHVHHARASVAWPVRIGLTVLALVVGGLLVAAAVVVAVRSGLPMRPVPAWTVPAAGVLVAAPFLLVRMRRVRRRKGDAGQAFLVTSAFKQKYWIAGFVQRMHGALDRNGIDLVLKVPDRDYDAAAQAYHLRKILTRKHDYIGGLVVATEVPRLRADFAEFCSELALPVVFTDIEPFDDESQYPDNAAFVGYLGSDLGALAGHWLVAHLRRHGVRRPRVLIVASEEHPNRQAYCAEVLRAGFADASITIDDRCAFHRSRAHDAVRAHIRLLHPGKARLDAVFCTNDEMALGAVDALRATTSQATADTVVVGVDGITEARNLIDTGVGPLRATVVQDSHRLAESAVHVLERMRDGRRTAKRTILHPEVYQVKH